MDMPIPAIFGLVLVLTVVALLVYTRLIKPRLSRSNRTDGSAGTTPNDFSDGAGGGGSD